MEDKGCYIQLNPQILQQPFVSHSTSYCGTQLFFYSYSIHSTPSVSSFASWQRASSSTLKGMRRSEPVSIGTVWFPEWSTDLIQKDSSRLFIAVILLCACFLACPLLFLTACCRSPFVCLLVVTEWLGDFSSVLQDICHT